MGASQSSETMDPVERMAQINREMMAHAEPCQQCKKYKVKRTSLINEYNALKKTVEGMGAEKRNECIAKCQQKYTRKYPSMVNDGVDS